MISRIEGQLLTVTDHGIEIRCGHLVHLILVPASDRDDLEARIGDEVQFHTLQYFEAQGQGSSFIPRLIGFRSAQDREFFELFTTVKGVGNRKALRAFELPVSRIAAAIADRDARLLVTLPEIGKRTADTIVAELHGKVDRFVEIKMDTDGAVPRSSAGGQLVRDALAVLLQLGEPKLHAQQLIDRALADDDSIETSEALVAAAVLLREAP